jgi:hypothetical protein
MKALSWYRWNQFEARLKPIIQPAALHFGSSTAVAVRTFRDGYRKTKAGDG